MEEVTEDTVDREEVMEGIEATEAFTEVMEEVTADSENSASSKDN